jgi:hypothetical protein
LQIGLLTQGRFMSYYNTTHNDHPNNYHKPRVLNVIENFLSAEESKNLQSLIHDGWTLAPNTEHIKFLSKDLYRHYAWDGDWNSTRWLDTTAIEWENLYNRISELLPPHRIHWCDLKITPPLSTGVVLHRDKDPWLTPETEQEFSHAITVLCNLNTDWSPDWGGSFILHQAYQGSQDIEFQEYQSIPITPGQLLIMENCYHSIDPITIAERYRISFILQVLVYK